MKVKVLKESLEENTVPKTYKNLEKLIQQFNANFLPMN